MEQEYKVENDQVLNDTIKGLYIKKDGDNYSVLWQMRDFVLEMNKADSPEFSIWFWTKYFDLKDFDGDGLIDPIIIYGTSGINGIEDGRIKILVYYQGQKQAIRHQNGTLDFQRNTQVDSGFYNLPIQIQNHVRGIMKKMIENDHVIFPSGYEENMNNKMMHFDQK